MKKKRYFLEDNVVTDEAVGITYTRREDGSVLGDSKGKRVTFHHNPITGPNADLLWDDLLTRCNDENNNYYWYEDDAEWKTV